MICLTHKLNVLFQKLYKTQNKEVQMKTVQIFFSIFAYLIISTKIYAADLTNVNELPEWFKDNLKREVKITKKTRLKFKPLNINKKILGKVKLVSKGDSFWSYTINIGRKTAPLECYVVPEHDGTSNTLHYFIESSLDQFAKGANLSVSSTQNFALDVGVIANTPYISYDIFYIVGNDKKKSSGIIKALSASTNNTLQVCLHNSIGFRETFFKVFESFTKAFIDSDENKEFYNTVYQFNINGIPAGYVRDKYSLDEDGDVYRKSDSAMMIPVNNSSVARLDSEMKEWSGIDGSVINAISHSVENGSLASLFSINYKEDKWHVNGELQGKAINSTLVYDKWLLSGYGNYLETIGLAQSEEKAAEYYAWIPDTDPTSAIKVKIRKISDNTLTNFEYSMGQLLMKLSIDEKGNIKKGFLHQGPVETMMKPLYIEGEPILK